MAGSFSSVRRRKNSRTCSRSSASAKSGELGTRTPVSVAATPACTTRSAAAPQLAQSFEIRPMLSMISACALSRRCCRRNAFSSGTPVSAASSPCPPSSPHR